MHPPLIRILACLTLIVASAAHGIACTAAVRTEIVKRATKLMPPALARQLERHAAHAVAGATEGVADPPSPISAVDPGDADEQLAAALSEVKRLLDTHAPMPAVARAFGRVARHATDVSFALHVGPHDPRAAVIYPRFCRFVEERMPRFRTTFPGYVDEDLARGDVAAFARRVARDARRDYDGILRSYYPPDRSPVAADFDDRSVAFGSASLEVSLALTSVARSWLFAWHRAGGDLTGTPFLTDSRTNP